MPPVSLQLETNWSPQGTCFHEKNYDLFWCPTELNFSEWTSRLSTNNTCTFFKDILTLNPHCHCLTPLWFYTTLHQNVLLADPNNLAWQKPTWQSSTKLQAFSSRAVDGNSDTYFENGFCSRTLEEHVFWWLVDLKQVCVVSGVLLTVAHIFCEHFCLAESRSFTPDTTIPEATIMFIYFSVGLEHNQTVTIAVGNAMSSCYALDLRNFSTCGNVIEKLLIHKTQLVTCDKPVKGRYVTIFKKRPAPFVLCEVEVLGSGRHSHYCVPFLSNI